MTPSIALLAVWPVPLFEDEALTACTCRARLTRPVAEGAAGVTLAEVEEGVELAASETGDERTDGATDDVTSRDESDADGTAVDEAVDAAEAKVIVVRLEVDADAGRTELLDASVLELADVTLGLELDWAPEVAAALEADPDAPEVGAALEPDRGALEYDAAAVPLDVDVMRLDDAADESMAEAVVELRAERA